MGINSILKFFLPQDDTFIPYLEQAAENLKKAGASYVALTKADSREQMIALRDEIKEFEHRGDEITHKIFEELNKSFITPFDREDIYDLTKSMDDVVDLINHVADLLVLYQIHRLDNGIGLLLEVANRAIEEIYGSIRQLRKLHYETVRIHIVRVHELENEGDRLYKLFISKLFSEEKDAIRLLKYNSLLNEMEHTIDKCEDLMNSLEAIMLKNA